MASNRKRPEWPVTLGVVVTISALLLVAFGLLANSDSGFSIGG
ncbi:hypothetical protein ABFT23_04940 [Nocardioides sp. C4-1]